MLRKCGYQQSNHIRTFLPKNTRTNIKMLKFHENINDNYPISTYEITNYTDFLKNSINIPSRYNGKYMKTLLTQINNVYYALVNVIFIKDNKRVKIQFIAYDGNELNEEQFNNPSYIINSVNANKFIPININLNEKNNDILLSNFDAYSGGIWYCLMLYELYDRVGLIDDDMVFISIVNTKMANAFWNGFYMTYGNGYDISNRFSPFTSIDIVGHEITHGLIETTCKLEYSYESGALNESRADHEGTCLTKYYDDKNNTNIFSWIEGIIIDNTNKGIRNLSNPKEHQQPDTYNGLYWCNNDEDNGGVHVNSGVCNYFFYLVCNKIAGKNDFGTEYCIRNPINMYDVCKILYKCMTGQNHYLKLPSNCSYTKFCMIFIHNSELYVEEHNLNKNIFLETINEACKAINIFLDKNTYSRSVSSDSSTMTNKHINTPNILITLGNYNKDIIIKGGYKLNGNLINTFNDSFSIKHTLVSKSKFLLKCINNEALILIKIIGKNKTLKLPIEPSMSSEFTTYSVVYDVIEQIDIYIITYGIIAIYNTFEIIPEIAEI